MMMTPLMLIPIRSADTCEAIYKQIKLIARLSIFVFVVGHVLRKFEPVTSAMRHISFRKN